MKKFSLVPVLAVAALAFSTQAGAQQFGNPSDAVRASYVDDARQPYYEWTRRNEKMPRVCRAARHGIDGINEDHVANGLALC